MECKGQYGCGKEKKADDFYGTDTTCKECRKAAVRNNRAAKSEYYREYDRNRFRDDPRVIARHKRYQATDAGKASLRKARDKWGRLSPIKRGASNIVNYAVRAGRLSKPYECSECGAGGRIHGHHDDYAFPLVVRWLCSSCHTAWHKENGSGANG